MSLQAEEGGAGGEEMLTVLREKGWPWGKARDGKG